MGKMIWPLALCLAMASSWADDDEHHERHDPADGVVAVAVPVLDTAGRVVAALNSSGHTKRMTKAQLVRERLPMLRETSERISRELAHLPAFALSAQA